MCMNLLNIFIDLFRPYPRFINGIRERAGRNIWIVNLIDAFTKVVELVPIEDKTQLTLAKLFYNNWVYRYGVPSTITTDNSTEFETDFKHLISRLGIYYCCRVTMGGGLV